MRGVEIIGGGLAGLGLGMALRKDSVPVVILEVGHYPRHRVCGEFITSLDMTTQRALGLETILRRARQATRVSWCEDGQADIQHRMPEPALCLSRHVLDEAMAARFVDLGGDLRTGVRGDISPQAGRVLACGRRPDPSSPWVGVKEHFRDLDLRDELEVHFGRAGYIGLVRVEEDTVNVCGLLQRGSADFTAPLAAIARDAGWAGLSQRLARAQPVAASRCAVAGMSYDTFRAEQGVLSLGDRASVVPPFTGHGMTIALQSAAVAAPIMVRWARGHTDWSSAVRAVSLAQERRFGRRLRVARLLHPWLLQDRTRGWARKLHRRGLLPVGWLYRMLH